MFWIGNWLLFIASDPRVVGMPPFASTARMAAESELPALPAA